MSGPPDRPRRPGDRGKRPPYTVYRSRRRLLGGLGSGGEPEFEGAGTLRGRLRRPRERGPRRIPARRVLKYVLLAVAGWLALSLLLFLISAQIEKSKVSDAANKALDNSGWMLTSPNNILVLGSDARPKGTHEKGATVIGQGPSRSDTIMLIRAGGGHNARLSIPRDTVVNIPGHGPDKINAAYAIGGPALAITTIKQFLGVEVNHLIEVNFENFPDFINAMGGISVKTGCVTADVNGGDRNGGVTIRVPHAGTHHFDGKHALALARIRKNTCHPAEDDHARAARQQQILSAIKSRLLSVRTFFHLPWVSWTAPKAIRSDMGGTTLLSLFTAMSLSGSPPTHVLRTIPAALPNGSVGQQVISDEDKAREVRRFLNG